MGKVGLLPAAGLATRLKIDTPKELIHAAGKPVIDCSVENFLNAGIKNIVVVIRKGKEAIKEHLDKTFKRAKFTYVYQSGKIGNLIDAVKTAHKEIEGHQVYFCMADTFIFPNPFENVNKSGSELFLVCHNAKNPKDLNVVLSTGRVIEKPKNPKTDVSWGALVWDATFTRKIMKCDDLTKAINSTKRKKFEVLIDYYHDVGIKK